MPTPLTSDEDLDEPALRNVTRYVLDGGVHGLWMLGSGGEQPMLSLEVSRRVLEIAVEEARGHVPVIAGIGACSVRQALINLRMAEEAGVDAVQSVEPYYFKLRVPEIVDYFLTLADASALPMVIYHHPNRWPDGSMSAAMLPHTHGRLAKHPNVIGMKDVTHNPRDFQRLVFTLGSEDFTILTAAGRLLLFSLAVGGHGAAIAEGVIAPRLCVELYEAFQEGDLSRAQEIQRRLAPLGDVLNAPSTGAASLKQAMSLLGLCDVHLARPIHGMGEEDVEMLAGVMEDLGLI
jgi:4-hydroxy-tetrahydrodipicolinate synthase